MKIQNTHIVPNNIGEIRLCDYARNIFAEYIPSRNGNILLTIFIIT